MRYLLSLTTFLVCAYARAHHSTIQLKALAEEPQAYNVHSASYNVTPFVSKTKAYIDNYANWNNEQSGNYNNGSGVDSSWALARSVCGSIYCNGIAEAGSNGGMLLHAALDQKCVSNFVASHRQTPLQLRLCK